MNQCACGSKIEFADCCKPYLEGKRKPSTAEALMRSRYTAFTQANVDYIEDTTHPSSRSTFDREGTQQWAESSEWKGLEILKTHDGKEGDSTGAVEFIAHYQIGDQSHDHHEKAEFKTRDGQWYFVDGKYVREPYRAEEKAGRNDPCPCGSGKKYKKCCGQ